MTNFSNLEEAITHYENEVEIALTFPMSVYLAYNECMYPAQKFDLATINDFVDNVEESYVGHADSNAKFAKEYALASNEIPERLIPVIDWDAYWNLRLESVYAVHNGYYFL